MTDIEPAVTRVFDEAKALLLKKHHDYGASNISAAPGGPLNGLRVRMWDKTARLNNLVDKGVEPENESLRDTLIDLLNYSAIGLMVLDQEWPGAEVQKPEAPARVVIESPALIDSLGRRWEYDLLHARWCTRSWHNGQLADEIAPDRAYLNAVFGPLTEER